MPTAMVKRNGALFIICGPSGAGKTSLVRTLVDTIPDLQVSISHTTRPARAHEQHGTDYFFVSQDEFQTLLEQNRFLEHANVFGNLYATSRVWVQERLSNGQDVVLEIDWQGAQQARTIIRDAITIFILPPSLVSLEARLKGRGDEEQNIQSRMRKAASEIEHYHEFDYVVTNDSFDRTLQQLSAIIISARHEQRRHRDYFERLARQLR